MHISVYFYFLKMNNMYFNKHIPLQNSIYQVEEKDWSLAMFEWAWFTVNTRAVYLDYDPRLQNKSNKFLPEDSLGTEIKV